MKIKLRNKDYCDGCNKSKRLNTLGQHLRCEIYGKNMTPQEDIFLTNRGLGYFPRLKKCKEENKVEVIK